MKKFILMALVSAGVYSMPLSAAEVDTDHLMFPEDVEVATDQVFANASNYIVAGNNDVRTKAIQHKFASKRSLNTRRFSGVMKKDYNEDSAWIGATQTFEEGPASAHGNRLNKQFKSRRAYRP